MNKKKKNIWPRYTKKKHIAKQDTVKFRRWSVKEINPFPTPEKDAINSQIPSVLSPYRECGANTVKEPRHLEKERPKRGNVPPS